jgi:soluble lytic murein transglycosylase
MAGAPEDSNEAAPQNAPQWRPLALTRLPLLLAVSCLGTAAALLGGRALLARLPAPNPNTATNRLERLRRWAPDPSLRREASLLLQARYPDDLALNQQLLRNQGWGSDPLAAVALKNGAQTAAALGQHDQARRLWQTLLRRFDGSMAQADALYALGRRQPGLRSELLQRFPAHPAALAAALEAGPQPAARLAGALHLARWGARWPGAEQRLRQACGATTPAAPGPAAPGPAAPGPTAPQRASLAEGLAQLGDGPAALACLAGGGQPAAAEAQLSSSGRLTLAKALLPGDPPQQQRALALLLAVAAADDAAPPRPEAEEAVRLLARQQGAAAATARRALPARWQDSAPLLAQRALADPQDQDPKGQDPQGQSARAVLRRWPDDPASWELQWELARRQLLAGQWAGAASLLSAIPPERLPAPLAARSRFWLGMVEQYQGNRAAARARWQQLRRSNPGGYYGWRAAVQLGELDSSLSSLQPSSLQPSGGPQPAAPPPANSWQPLASGDAELDRLWRLDQRTEAWESWRARRGNSPAQAAPDLLVEGRLRQGVGDDWTGLGQLEQAALRLKPDQCALLPSLERSLHPPRFLSVFEPVAQQHQLPLALLQGLAKQESRFTPTVHSVAGAVGLMQLMPATAAELAGTAVSNQELEDPQRNAALGGLYLAGLLRQWAGDPIAAVASYNAGPGAVAGWINPRLAAAPELWVEGIPYPETRLYVKKVLGNAWSYRQPGLPGC